MGGGPAPPPAIGIASKRRTGPGADVAGGGRPARSRGRHPCGTDVIVTFNLADFSAETLKRKGTEGRHPDEFILRLLERNPAAVCWAARTAAEKWITRLFDGTKTVARGKVERLEF
jgi:hypothetical protein